MESPEKECHYGVSLWFLYNYMNCFEYFSEGIFYVVIYQHVQSILFNINAISQTFPFILKCHHVTIFANCNFPFFNCKFFTDNDYLEHNWRQAGKKCINQKKHCCYECVLLFIFSLLDEKHRCTCRSLVVVVLDGLFDSFELYHLYSIHR